MRIYLILLIVFLISCKENEPKLNKIKTQQPSKKLEKTFSDTINIFDNITEKTKINDTINRLPIEDYSSEFVNLKTLSNDFVYDIKYATADNFLKQAVYDCPECYLRKETALALIKAHEVFIEKGYKILIYDCYRPLDVQKKMWAILPGTHYVANPKKGSKHNRGAAVDLTLIDKNGQIVDMGTAFDFFGKEAHHTYTNLTKEVLENRKLLRETLNQFNFRHISSEWWHYEYRPEMYKPVSNFKWDCE